ncbi:unnamed protein product, partial [Clonostachys rosea f. rosea IK726]
MRRGKTDVQEMSGRQSKMRRLRPPKDADSGQGTAGTEQLQWFGFDGRGRQRLGAMAVEELKAVCHIHVGTRAMFPRAQRATLAGSMEVELCRLTAGCLTFSTAIGLTP